MRTSLILALPLFFVACETQGELEPFPQDVDAMDLFAPPVQGTVWRMDVANGDFTEPEGIGPLIAAFVTEQAFLFELDLQSASPEFLTAPALSGTDAQNPCMETLSMDAYRRDGRVGFTAVELLLDVDGLDLPVMDVRGVGERGPGLAIEDIVLAGDWDTRELSPLLGMGNDPFATCDLMAAFGVGCEPCADGLETCIPLRVEGLIAEVVPGADLVARDAADIAADPQCAP